MIGSTGNSVSARLLTSSPASDLVRTEAELDSPVDSAIDADGMKMLRYLSTDAGSPTDGAEPGGDGGGSS